MLMYFSLFRSIVLSNIVLTLLKMLAFVFLPAISGNSYCFVLDSLINAVLLLGAPMVPTWRLVKIWKCLK
jgi:small-conductance mechanosensitive channel